jgi:hypothetical protein
MIAGSERGLSAPGNTTNADSGTVSGFSIRPEGAIALLDADGVTGTAGPGVTDVTLTGNGRYLYTLPRAPAASPPSAWRTTAG